MDEELERIIRLNLRDFLEQREGFVLDHAESSANSYKLRRGGELLIVHQNEETGVWGYMNLHDHDDDGTLIDYLQNRNGGKAVFTLGHVKARVRGRVVSPKPLRGAIVPGVPRPVSLHAPRDLSHVAKRWEEARTVWGLPYYLEGRGLTAETVKAYAASLRMDKKGNVLFGHTNQDGEPVGYEIKGVGFTGFAKGGVRLLCRLGPIEGAEPVKIALTESGVDALSLAQLTGRRDALFCSTGGAVSKHTLEQVKRLAAKHPAAEILLAFDNDDEGFEFAARVEDALALAGREGVRRLVPKLKDWNDELKARLAGGAARAAAPAPP